MLQEVTHRTVSRRKRAFGVFAAIVLLAAAMFACISEQAYGTELEIAETTIGQHGSDCLEAQVSNSTEVFVDARGVFHYSWFHAVQINQALQSRQNPSRMSYAGAVRYGYVPCGSCKASSSRPSSGNSMHRLYNPYSGEHFYTGNTSEKNYLVKLGWRYEGVGWNAPDSGRDVYRLYNPYSGEHHFTLNADEKDNCVKVGWRYEGVGWKSGGDVPVYREYNPYARAYYHNYTTDTNEHSRLCALGWKSEGVGWYGV